MTNSLLVNVTRVTRVTKIFKTFGFVRNVTMNWQENAYVLSAYTQWIGQSQQLGTQVPVGFGRVLTELGEETLKTFWSDTLWKNRKCGGLSPKRHVIEPKSARWSSVPSCTTTSALPAVMSRKSKNPERVVNTNCRRDHDVVEGTDGSQTRNTGGIM